MLLEVVSSDELMRHCLFWGTDVEASVDFVGAISQNKILLESWHDADLTGLEVLVESFECPGDPDNRGNFGNLFTVGDLQFFGNIVGYDALVSSSVNDSGDVVWAVGFVLSLRSEWPPMRYDDDVASTARVIIWHFAFSVPGPSMLSLRGR